jgi:hypothetical protein
MTDLATLFSLNNWPEHLRFFSDETEVAGLIYQLMGRELANKIKVSNMLLTGAGSSTHGAARLRHSFVRYEMPSSSVRAQRSKSRQASGRAASRRTLPRRPA